MSFWLESFFRYAQCEFKMNSKNNRLLLESFKSFAMVIRSKRLRNGANSRYVHNRYDNFNSKFGNVVWLLNSKKGQMSVSQPAWKDVNTQYTISCDLRSPTKDDVILKLTEQITLSFYLFNIKKNKNSVHDFTTTNTLIILLFVIDVGIQNRFIVGWKAIEKNRFDLNSKQTLI